MKNVFVVGLDEFNLQIMRSMRKAASTRFLPLLDYVEVRNRPDYPVSELLRTATRRLDTYRGPIDAIVCHWDFPAITLATLLAARYRLRAPSMDSLLKCEHKALSRKEQCLVVPECVPAFQHIDPRDGNAASHITLRFPFWIKPVVSFASYLGFLVENEKQLDDALKRINHRIGALSTPFSELVVEAGFDPALLNDGFVIVEELLRGWQCTVSGYARNAQVTVYGVVDSLKEPDSSSFACYLYPSRLPPPIKRRVAELSRRVMQHIGYDNGAFNIEFFWDRDKDRLGLLEINPRISQSHADLYRKVDGETNHSIMVDVALGEPPRFPHRSGKHAIAGKFFLRSREDGFVRSTPGPAQVRKLQQLSPDALAYIAVEPGSLLSEKLLTPDSYSYELGYILLGANDEEQLMHLAEQAKTIMRVDIEPRNRRR